MLREMARSALRPGLALRWASGALAGSCVAIYVDAPKADMGDGLYDHEIKPDVFPEWAHDIARVPVFAACTAMAKLYLHVANTTTIHGREKLTQQLTSRPAGTSLITVSNHSATVDDPAVIAAMMPWRYAWPSLGRWSLCSQEYSYTKNRLLSSIFYAAKTLPVKRGAGIDHKMLEVLFQKVEAGEWVHIFPEGKIDQYQVLGGREGPRAEEIGRLKWGVGKLIARAEQRPVVVPFYHKNMEQLMPQDEHNRLISMFPKTNLQLGVRVGEPINFDDLFEQYEKDRVVGASPWATEEREKALFSAITKRIEDTLLELAKQMDE